MHVNVATTLSMAAMTSGLSVAVLASRLAQTEETRHFRFAAVATMAATVYAATDLVIAAQMAPLLAVWAGRLSMVALCVHGIGWLYFFAAWDRRAFRPSERVAVAACVVSMPASLVPGLAIDSAVTLRAVPALDVVYSEPVPGPLALPVMGAVFLAQTLGAVAALRTGRAIPRARRIVVGFAVHLAVAVVDTLSALHVLSLPYLASVAIMVVPLFVCAEIVAHFAETSRTLAQRDAELAGARAALVERERLAAVGQLAAVVAHEVRNPVAIIFGALSALRKRTRDASDEEVLAIVEQEAQRLERLVVRLLDSVRPFALQYTREPIAELVTEAVTAATAAAGISRDEVEIAPLPTDSLDGDGVLLGQAVLNLIANALDANGRRSPVKVRALVQAAHLRVEITDDGEGVAEANAGRLFTPFFTTRATGTGLGLALVKRIAEAHGGTVIHEKPPSGGASFVMSVPLVAPVAKDAMLAPPPASPS